MAAYDDQCTEMESFAGPEWTDSASWDPLLANSNGFLNDSHEVQMYFGADHMTDQGFTHPFILNNQTLQDATLPFGIEGLDDDDEDYDDITDPNHGGLAPLVNENMENLFLEHTPAAEQMESRFRGFTPVVNENEESLFIEHTPVPERMQHRSGGFTHTADEDYLPQNLFLEQTPILDQAIDPLSTSQQNMDHRFPEQTSGGDYGVQQFISPAEQDLDDIFSQQTPAHRWEGESRMMAWMDSAIEQENNEQVDAGNNIARDELYSPWFEDVEWPKLATEKLQPIVPEMQLATSEQQLHSQSPKSVSTIQPLEETNSPQSTLDSGYQSGLEYPKYRFEVAQAAPYKSPYQTMDPDVALPSVEKESLLTPNDVGFTPISRKVSYATEPKSKNGSEELDDVASFNLPVFDKIRTFQPFAIALALSEREEREAMLLALAKISGKLEDNDPTRDIPPYFNYLLEKLYGKWKGEEKFQQAVFAWAFKKFMGSVPAEQSNAQDMKHDILKLGLDHLTTLEEAKKQYGRDRQMYHRILMSMVKQNEKLSAQVKEMRKAAQSSSSPESSNSTLAASKNRKETAKGNAIQKMPYRPAPTPAASFAQPVVQTGAPKANPFWVCFLPDSTGYQCGGVNRDWHMPRALQKKGKEEIWAKRVSCIKCSKHNDHSRKYITDVEALFLGGVSKSSREKPSPQQSAVSVAAVPNYDVQSSGFPGCMATKTIVQAPLSVNQRRPVAQSDPEAQYGPVQPQTQPVGQLRPIGQPRPIAQPQPVEKPRSVAQTRPAVQPVVQQCAIAQPSPTIQQSRHRASAPRESIPQMPVRSATAGTLNFTIVLDSPGKKRSPDQTLYKHPLERELKRTRRDWMV